MKFRLITHIDRVNYFSDGYIEYYKKFFEIEEFYFLVQSYYYDDIVDYLKKRGFKNDQISKYKSTSYIAKTKKNLQNEKKKEFIEKGFTVVYSSQDERIFHPDLRNYIANNLTDYIAPRGVVIVQHNEPKLDITKPLLSQRSYCIADVYGRDKPQILKKNINWDSGMHRRPKGCPVDENIYLVDIGKSCAHIALENNQVSQIIYQKLANYYGCNDVDKIKELFSNRKVKLIPETIKDHSTFF